jgi:hypothetical protein
MYSLGGYCDVNELSRYSESSQWSVEPCWVVRQLRVSETDNTKRELHAGLSIMSRINREMFMSLGSVTEAMLIGG